MVQCFLYENIRNSSGLKIITNCFEEHYYDSTVKLGYNELSVVNEHLILTNRFIIQIGYFSTKLTRL